MKGLSGMYWTLTVQQRRALGIISIAAMAAAIATFAALAGGCRINLTPSEPLGLWRIVPLNRPAAVGDLVFICPPEITGIRVARARGYLRFGLCLGSVAPLIKTVIAVAGQHIEIAASVSVDGRLVASSNVMHRDGMGRPLSSFSGGVVPPGYVFLHSSFPGSYDSRYFGPLPASGILGRAQEVLTYAR
jgi:conjugative transfer signal peptidase TraF